MASMTVASIPFEFSGIAQGDAQCDRLIDSPLGHLYALVMEVHISTDLQAKLEQWATATGRAADELVEDAVISYFEELMHTQNMLNERYDDIKSGRVTLIDGETAFARLKEKNKTYRKSNA